MDTGTFITLLITAIAAGFVAGLVGVGGGIVMVPMLVFVAGLSQKEAQGTSLAVLMIPIGIAVAVYNYYKAGQVNITYALVMVAFFAVGSFFGSKLAINLDQLVIRKIFAGIMIIAALKLFFSK